MDQPLDAVLFDRDGTLIRDVPYNSDPNRVTPMPGARELLRELRTHGLRTGVVSICPHHPDEGCACRKPAPGLVLSACAALGVSPERTLVVGDIGADVGAAEAAGAVPVLVPTGRRGQKRSNRPRALPLTCRRCWR